MQVDGIKGIRDPYQPVAATRPLPGMWLCHGARHGQVPAHIWPQLPAAVTARAHSVEPRLQDTLRGRQEACSARSKCGVCRERAGGFSATWVHQSLVEPSAIWPEHW